MEKILQINVTEEYHGKEIKQILFQAYHLTESLIKSAKFRPMGITVNGDSCTVRKKVSCNDVIKVILETNDEASEHLLPMPGPLSIVYEDEDLLVIDKEPGIVIHPSFGHYADSLANRIVAYYKERGQQIVIRPIGRLDKDTSGLICFGKNKAAATLLTNQRKEQCLKRHYLALVSGVLKEKKGTIEQPIMPDPDKLMKQMIHPDGQYAKTDYEVIAQYSDYALIRLKLHTGKTHQIRLHMASIGHPLLGDSIYNETPTKDVLPRTALHAWRIEGIHPFTFQPFSFTAPLPFDLQSILSANNCLN